ncbi:hypothetical protein AAON49_01785 [Pseudotenacibaculum sp. MALMAid0570]|uniref:hypothetical protein n=1 Tax=Pseudotenacibaculum sp. MALMAid0570 TaxID=3143938 RepID=UPI0032DEF5C3
MIKTDPTKVQDFFESSHKKLSLNEDRKDLLINIADKIAEVYQSSNQNVSVNFICTHNSRRSQLGQVWTYFASKYFDLNINAYSGGTEVTAFHRNTVQTLKQTGFIFNVKEFSHQNPVYEIYFDKAQDCILGFSKIFDNPTNKAPYIAVTTCNSADENCPFIAEAIHRFHLPYTDPKYADNTLEQDDAYLKTNKEVASEIYFIFDRVKSLIS